MKKHLPLLFIAFLIVWSCSTSKQALNLIEKHKFEAAQNKLDKRIGKDSLQADLFYVYSLLYTDTAFSNYNIDSSFHYIQRALSDYQKTEEKGKEKMYKKAGIDSLTLSQQKLNNDSLAFDRANDIHSVQSYQNFIEQHAEAPQISLAIELRNQLAFDSVSQVDSYQAYKYFMDTYPEAEEFSQAKERYNTLVFRDKTEDGNLKSYLDFLKSFPDSPYRPQAEAQILQISTASNQYEAYEDFIKNYPKSRHLSLAVNLLFHLYKSQYSSEAYFSQYSSLPLLDSLRQASKTGKQVLAAIFESGKYGLLNREGEFVINNDYQLIPPSYFCEGMPEEYIHLAKVENQQVKHSLLTKDNQLIYEYGLPLNGIQFPGSLYQQNVIKLGAGLLLIENEKGKFQLMHQSGHLIYPSVTQSFPLDDAELIQGINAESESFQFIKIQEKGKWGLISFSGRTLIKAEYEDIEDYGNFIVITQGERKAITTREKIIEAANQKTLKLAFSYKDIALIDGQHIAAFTDEYETALDTQLNTVVPLARHNIIRLVSDDKSGGEKWLLREVRNEAYVKNDSLRNRNTSLYYLYDKQNLNEQSETTYQKAYFNNRWLALKKKNKFELFDLQQQNEAAEYDSVKLVGESFALLFENHKDADDSVKVLFQTGGKLALVSPERINFLLLKPSSTTGDQLQEYLLISPKNGPKEVWSQAGKRLLSDRFSSISLNPAGLFVIENNGKKGLLDSLGNKLLDIKYQGISNYKDSTLALFQNKKFGIYHYPSNTTIEPKYEATLQLYGQPQYNPLDSSMYEIFIAKKGEGYGLINQKNTQLTDFAFQEIRYWNDTSALVKTENTWSLYKFSISEKYNKDSVYTLYEGIEDFKTIEDTQEEKILKIYKSGGYGIISSRKGEVLSPTYDDIRLFGDIADPESIYYSEKYVPEADLYIIIHLDMDGQLIKRQALTSEQYDMIYCEE